ncbi:uncharacterized protein LOC126108420 [Schistocerca cancellata]|uniref:uncharacterized protein LOC126108420 n=1 Tax=Schistocerca cancellata TaxID=274614 RepID=UPI0021186D8F|nr:uncharacterized protein LOC126108420 [Schistocerca cancellata]
MVTVREATLGTRASFFGSSESKGYYTLTGTRGTLEPPSAAVPAVARLAASVSSYGPPPPPAGGVEGEGEGCARPRALAALHRLTWGGASRLAEELGCRIAADCTDSCPARGLNDVEWNVTTLQTDHLRCHVLSQSLDAVRRITRAIRARGECETHHKLNFIRKHLNKTELRVQRTVYPEQLSNYSRDFAQLFSLGVTQVSRLFIPLGFENMGNDTTEQRLHGWIKDMERVRDMLHTKLSSWVHDMYSASEQPAHYEIEGDKNIRGNLILRRPLLNDELLEYQPRYLFFREDFGVLCEERQPEASQMFGLADALYDFYYTNWYNIQWAFMHRFADGTETVDEEWQLEDKSNTTLSVDTDCVQLLVNALDHPTCPLEDLPPETVQQRLQCRVQLWGDLVQRSTHIPVTSYLAYTQRANINLCLLAWMAVSSFGISNGGKEELPLRIQQNSRSQHDWRPRHVTRWVPRVAYSHTPLVAERC